MNFARAEQNTHSYIMFQLIHILPLTQLTSCSLIVYAHFGLKISFQHPKLHVYRTTTNARKRNDLHSGWRKTVISSAPTCFQGLIFCWQQAKQWERSRGINQDCESILVALMDLLLHRYFSPTLLEVDHFGRPGQKRFSTACIKPKILLGASKAHTLIFGSTLFIFFLSHYLHHVLKSSLGTWV